MPLVSIATEGFFRFATGGRSRYTFVTCANAFLKGREMTFAEKLRALRDAAGLSEAKLAAASGVSFSAIHEYGLGRRNPSLESAVKLARALGVGVEVFADCVDDAPEKPARKPLVSTAAPPAKPAGKAGKKPRKRKE